MSTHPFKRPYDSPGETILKSIYTAASRCREDGVSEPFFALLSPKDAHSLLISMGARNELLHTLSDDDLREPPKPDWFPEKTRMMNATPIHFDCVVCQARASVLTAEQATMVLFVMLLADSSLSGTYTNLCFEHRRKTDEALKSVARATEN